MSGGRSGIGGAVGLAFAITAAFSFVGAIVGFMLMVIMNGFSEKQAMPVFIGYVVLWIAANAITVGVVCAGALERGGITGGRRVKIAAGLAAGFTVLPFAVFFVVVSLGHLGIL